LNAAISKYSQYTPRPNSAGADNNEITPFKQDAVCKKKRLKHNILDVFLVIFRLLKFGFQLTILCFR